MTTLFVLILALSFCASKGVGHVLQVMSVSNFSSQHDDREQAHQQAGLNARRGGFLHGTKLATTSGWKPVERIVVGDLVRTLDHGFKEVRRISGHQIQIDAQETRDEYLPVYVPVQAAFNARPVWLMPEQGVAVNLGKIDPGTSGHSVVPARMFSGKCRMSSQAPGLMFQVCTLYFDEAEVIFLEGGLQAFCPPGGFGSGAGASPSGYHVAEGDEAVTLAHSVASRGDMSALANPLGALPAPISQDTIVPTRPVRGKRRPGRPGRPPLPTLFLRPEWMMITYRK